MGANWSLSLATSIGLVGDESGEEGGNGGGDENLRLGSV